MSTQLMNCSFNMQFVFISFYFLISWVGCPKTDPLRVTVTPDDQRSFIKCGILLKKTVSEIYEDLKKIAGAQVYSLRQVHRIYAEFLEVQEDTCRQVCARGPEPTVVTQENMERLRSIMEENREATIEELASMMDVGFGLVFRPVHAMGANKVVSRWVPHELTHEQRILRANMARYHFERYTNDNTILDRIIAIDETWLRSYDPKDDYASRQWVFPDEDP